MTRTHDLATKLATAVIDRIDTDRCCNNANIGDAILRELAVAALAPPGGTPNEPGDVRRAAEELISACVRKPELLKNTSSELDRLMQKLYTALYAAGWRP